MSHNGKIIYSQRGQPLLVFDDYKFAKANTSKCGKIRWKCSNRKCNIPVYTHISEESKIIDVPRNQHNHPAVTTIAREAFSNSLKRKAADALLEKPSKLICEELKTNEFREEIITPDINCIRRNMYMARRKILPKLPKNQEDVFNKVKEQNFSTNKGECFLQYLNETSKIIIFSCFTNLRFLCSSKTVYMDGTFQYAAKFFYQLFTVHAFENGHYVPVVFILLPDKRAETYVAAFKALIEKCNNYELTFSPQEVVIDFEYGIHKSVYTIWPCSKIIGCRFHLSQAWYRKILQLGLSEEYKNSESIVGQYLKIHFGIPFLEPNEAYDFFFNELYFLLPNDARVIEFRSYLENNYFKLDCHFPPAIWASSTNFINRTTNGCESFHSKFNECFYSPHPNVFHFANVLLQLQTLIYIKIKTANLFVKKETKTTKAKREYINALTNQYRNIEISRYTYVKLVSFKNLQS